MKSVNFFENPFPSIVGGGDNVAFGLFAGEECNVVIWTNLFVWSSCLWNVRIRSTGFLQLVLEQELVALGGEESEQNCTGGALGDLLECEGGV